MTERERVKQWFRDNAKYDHTDPDSVAIVDDMIVIVAEFSAKRVREELEAAAKELCHSCSDGVPLFAADNTSQLSDVHADGIVCKTSPIRKRLSELAGSEDGSR